MDYQAASIDLHKKQHGKLSVQSKVPLATKEDLSLVYTPGVAGPSLAIAKDKDLAKELTWKGNLVAVVSDGSAVLGLGNIGPEAAIPVMEGKCLLLKEFGGVDAVPIVLATQDTEEIINTVVAISPSFAGINLEDISAPRCFEIEERLQELLDIPVFHDDQHGTAIVLLAALINAGKVVGKDIKKLKVVVNGAGAAAIATTRLLNEYGFEDLILCDSKGVISSSRGDLNPVKKSMLEITNKDDISGSLKEAIAGSDIFVGLSAAGALTKEMMKTMNSDSIVVAMANPVPEIMPDEAKSAGAAVVATGRSDFPNQVNNVLGFPGIFRGLLDKKVTKVTTEIKIRAAEAIAELVEQPSADMIIPSPLDKRVAKAVAAAI